MTPNDFKSLLALITSDRLDHLRGNEVQAVAQLQAKLAAFINAQVKPNDGDSPRAAE